MRILFASHSSSLAGAERSLLELINEAVARGHEALVSMPDDGALRQKLAAEQPTGVRVARIPCHRWMSARGQGLVGIVRLLQCCIDTVRFLLLIRASHPDAVVVNTSVTPSPMLAARLAKVPCVTVIRESIATNPTLRSVLPTWLIRRCINAWSARVVTVSSYVARQFGYDSLVIPPAVVTRPARSRLASGASLRLIMIGSIGGDKNQLDAVESVRRACDKTAKPIRLDIVGDGSSENVADLLAAIHKAKLSDIVTLHGHRNDVESLLSDSDALLMCSRNEAFGRVTVEALQAGVPVIGYDCGGTSELLSSPRSGGLLVGPTPAQMACAIASLGSDVATLTRLKEDAWAAGRAMARESHACGFLNEVEGIVRCGERNGARRL